LWALEKLHEIVPEERFWFAIFSGSVGMYSKIRKMGGM
jgi:hypothetical protein